MKENDHNSAEKDEILTWHLPSPATGIAGPYQYPITVLERRIEFLYSDWMNAHGHLGLRCSHIIDKQSRPWSDAAFSGVWSGSALFANAQGQGFQITLFLWHPDVTATITEGLHFINNRYLDFVQTRGLVSLVNNITTLFLSKASLCPIYCLLLRFWVLPGIVSESLGKREAGALVCNGCAVHCHLFALLHGIINRLRPVIVVLAGLLFYYFRYYEKSGTWSQISVNIYRI